MSRPSATVIVPFLGDDGALRTTLDRLAALRLQPDDEVIVGDNRPGARAETLADNVRSVPADGERSPSHARNVAAAHARGDWLVFLDADVAPDPGLLDEYLDPPPTAGVAVGAVEGVADPDTVFSRYAVARRTIGQDQTLAHRHRPWAQAANLAVRRSAFEEVGGFTEGIRAAEDADLCWRLQDAGHELERRPGARVRHHHRHTLRGFVRQGLVHAAGGRWLNERYPGAEPAMGPRELVRRSGHFVLVAVRARDTEARRFAMLDSLTALLRELGRLGSNRAQ